MYKMSKANTKLENSDNNRNKPNDAAKTSVV